MKLKVTSRDDRVGVWQDWINMSQIGPQATVSFEFYIKASERGDYSKNILDIKIKDSSDRMLFNAGYYVPLKQWN